MRFGLPVLPWGFGGLGLIVPGAGRLGWGASLIAESMPPIIPPLVVIHFFVLYTVRYSHCVGFSGVCGSCGQLLGQLLGVALLGLLAWRCHFGVFLLGLVCAGCAVRAGWGVVGGGEKGKNSGGGCDNERKSSTPHMSDLNRAALGYPTTEILVA